MFLKNKRGSVKKLLIIVLMSSLTIFSQIHRKPAKIVKIMDGDTIGVIFRGRYERIRLIGIDTPETSANSRARRISKRTGKDLSLIISQGRRSLAFVKKLIGIGDRVYLEFDLDSRDRYGRLLAYVYLRDGSMLNELIIKSGYAYPLTYAPNIRYKYRFLKAYSKARKERRGLFR